MDGLQSGEGRMMIDSVVWGTIHQRNSHTRQFVTDTQTDSHVAVAIAAPTHCVGRAKINGKVQQSYNRHTQIT